MMLIADYDDTMKRLANVRQTVEDARRTIAAQKKVIDGMKEACKRIARAYENQDIGHKDFRVATKLVVEEALALAEGR